MKALIAILATVRLIEALSSLIDFTKPRDFEKESFRLFTLAGSHRITQKRHVLYKIYFFFFFFFFNQTSTPGDDQVAIVAATVYCSELINKLHAKF